MKLFKDLFVNKEIVELREKVDKLERIMKYSKPDGPSFMIRRKRGVIDDSEYICRYGCLPRWIEYENELFLYIDGEEYIIDIDEEVKRYDVLYAPSKIWVKGKLAYVDLHLYGCDHYKHFVIDYEKGTYVCEYKIKAPKDKTVVVDEVREENTENEP